MPLDEFNASSLTLLAAQPPSLPSADQTYDANWDQEYQHSEARLTGMRMWRYSWWASWAQLARFIHPRRYHWLVTANRMSRGSSLNDAIIDNTATLAMRVCAAGLWSGLTSPSRPWFKLSVPKWAEIDSEASDWIEDTQERLYAVLGKSNFYPIMAQHFEDVATFGTTPVIIYEDFDSGIRCYLPCAGEYYLAAGAKLTVDTLYREYTYTVAQIVEEFTLKNCPAEIRRMWQQGGGSLENEYVVAHSIEPNFPLDNRARDGGKLYVVPRTFAYRELYWLRGNKTPAPLRKRGFHERPFFASRWSTVSNDPYGRSPGMDALGDTKQLQTEQFRKGEFIEKLVRPPMGATPNLKNEPASINPANITFMADKEQFWPLFQVPPAALAPLVEDIKEVQQRIERASFVDVFMAISRMAGVQPRNELELSQRNLERLQALGPFITMFEQESADPAIHRTLGIMQRRGLLQPRPRRLVGVPLQIEYTSILRMAQQAAETAAIGGTIAVAGSMDAGAQSAGQRAPGRIINWDKLLRIYADKTNFPEEALLPEEVVTQQDQQTDAHLQRLQAAKSAMAAIHGAEVLSKTDVGGGVNALSTMLGTGQPGAGQGP